MTNERRFRILIVDDTETDRQVLRTTLQRIGFSDVQEANDGAMAIQKINLAAQMSQKFDLIFMDWMMPKMSGLQLLQTVREDRGYKGIPIVITTAEAAATTVTEALKAGASSYIVKPVEESTLRTKIEKLVKRA
jgi:two-component system, chemotaxis family, chemotaxis protein CheY